MKRLTPSYFIQFITGFYDPPKRKVKCQICQEWTKDAFPINGVLTNGYWMSALWFCRKHSVKDLEDWMQFHSHIKDVFYDEKIITGFREFLNEPA